MEYSGWKNNPMESNFDTPQKFYHTHNKIVSVTFLHKRNALLSNYSIIKEDRVGYMWHYYAKFVLSAIADDCNGDNRLLMLQYNNSLFLVRTVFIDCLSYLGTLTPCKINNQCWGVFRIMNNHEFF